MLNYNLTCSKTGEYFPTTLDTTLDTFFFKIIFQNCKTPFLLFLFHPLSFPYLSFPLPCSLPFPLIQLGSLGDVSSPNGVWCGALAANAFWHTSNYENASSVNIFDSFVWSSIASTYSLHKCTFAAALIQTVSPQAMLVITCDGRYRLPLVSNGWYLSIICYIALKKNYI